MTGYSIDVEKGDNKHFVGKAKSTISHVTKKRIKILSNGTLSTKSGARGPILRPYMETIFNIKNLLVRDRANLVEVLKDGTEITLSLNNYALDNEPKVVTRETKEPVKAEKAIKAETPIIYSSEKVGEPTITPMVGVEVKVGTESVLEVKGEKTKWKQAKYSSNK